MLEFVNRDWFLDYKLEYVHKLIDCYTKWLKKQKLWTFEIEITRCVQAKFKLLDFDKS